jgi:hypothetical protein
LGKRGGMLGLIFRNAKNKSAIRRKRPILLSITHNSSSAGDGKFNTG